MDRIRAPYSPGAGEPPPALVGRAQKLDDMDVALQRRQLGRSAKSVMLTGLRGVGKTVLLNEFGKTARTHGYYHEHIEVDESVDFPSVLAFTVRRLLLRFSAAQRMGERIQRALGVLKAFSVQWPNGPTFSADVHSVLGPADSGDLATDLAGLLCELGEAAQAIGVGVFLTIDQIQYLARPELSALMVSLHRATQLGLPVVVAGAGLPSLPALLGDAKSYAERMFDFAEIGSLSPTESAEAILRPAAQEGVLWQPAAVDFVVDLTRGYPYFLQAFSKQAWDMANGPTEISRSDVDASVAFTLAELDSGFFRVRISRTTDAERTYLRAMAVLGPGPYQTSEVASFLGKTVQQVGFVRNSLLKRGICYAPRWGQVAFTVPMFDGFLRRWLNVADEI